MSVKKALFESCLRAEIEAKTGDDLTAYTQSIRHGALLDVIKDSGLAEEFNIWVETGAI